MRGVGICLVAFNDACAFQAETTKRTLEMFLIIVAVPFLVIVMLGLRKNLTTGWMLEVFPTLPIALGTNSCLLGCSDASIVDGMLLNDLQSTGNSTVDDENQELVDTLVGTITAQSMLATALGLLETNILLLVKSVYNYFRCDK